ncbi:hypothetical protein Goari_005488, partial [Gossypium aridum]|nr:hypothetical protein [Gossypium aridum]
SIAKDLPQLEDLCITNCGVEKIVSKGEGVEEHSVRFEFPQVSSLEIVAWEHLRLIQGNEQPVLLVEEVIPKLEELELIDFGDMDQFPSALFQDIKVLVVRGGTRSSIFPFVRRFCNLD